jgi:hypothetical protein
MIDSMKKRKRFVVMGRLLPAQQNKEIDGTDYELGQFDSLRDAERP